MRAAFRREAFDLIEAVNELHTVDEVIDRMASSLSVFGAEHFILTGLPNPMQRFEQMVVLKKWPTGWFEVYGQEDFVRDDPVIRMCRRTVNPFDWTEAPYDKEREPRAAEVMNRATEYQMPRGFSLPIHGVNGYEACFSMSGVKIELSRLTKPAMHLMAHYTFMRVQELLRPDQAFQENPLNAREQEVLQWSAIGKSANEAAEIMGLTKRTIDEYAIRATRKLRAQNKTHAVARAIQKRLIDL